MPDYSFYSMPPGKTLLQLLEKKFSGTLIYIKKDEEIAINFQAGLPSGTDKSQTKSNLLEIFRDDIYSFRLEPGAVPSGEVQNPVPIISKGIMEIYSKERLIKEASPLLKVPLKISHQYRPMLQYFDFSPEQEMMLPHLEEGIEPRNLAVTTGNNLDLVLRTLYFLATMKLLSEFKKPEDETADLSQEARNFLEDLRKEIKAMESENYFERFGLGKNAMIEDITKAFKERARIYHPDTVVRRGLGKWRDQAEQYFGKLTETYNLLMDDEQRRAHIDKISVDPVEMENVRKVMNAEVSYQKGMIHYRKKEYAEAARLMAEAVENSPEDGHFLGTWAWVCYSDPECDREARRDELKAALMKAISLTPREPNLYYYIGKILSDANQLGSAKQYLAKACELHPDHLEAGRELRLIEKRRNTREQESILSKTSSFLGFLKKK